MEHITRWQPMAATARRKMCDHEGFQPVTLTEAPEHRIRFIAIRKG